MPDLTLKQNDTGRPVRAQLTQRDSSSPDPRAREAINLASAISVALNLKSRNEQRFYSGPCTITDAVNGWVQWFPIDADVVSVPEVYMAEFEITWPDGPETIPNTGYYELEIEAELG